MLHWHNLMCDTSVSRHLHATKPVILLICSHKLGLGCSGDTGRSQTTNWDQGWPAEPKQTASGAQCYSICVFYIKQKSTKWWRWWWWSFAAKMTFPSSQSPSSHTGSTMSYSWRRKWPLVLIQNPQGRFRSKTFWPDGRLMKHSSMQHEDKGFPGQQEDKGVIKLVKARPCARKSA